MNPSTLLRNSVRLLLILAVATGCIFAASAQSHDRSTPEGVIRELYALVTVPPGSTPDWERVRSLFLKEAVIALRSTRGHDVFSVDGFISDFVTFIGNAKVIETGFTERIVRMETRTFRDMAHSWVVFESEIPGSARGPRAGIDSFELIRQEGRWWIASIINDRPNAANPIPSEARQ